MEIMEAYNKLCDNRVLKEDFNIVERKGLTRTLDFPTIFKMEWIRLVLSRIHESFLWLEGGPVKINKRIIHQVTGYPTLDWPKTL